jgi:hypothetical protein
VPVTVLGRLLGVLWMFSGFVLMGLMGATITSEQLLDVSDSDAIAGVSDIRGTTLCTLDAAYLEFCNSLDLHPNFVMKTYPECYQLLADGVVSRPCCLSFRKRL